MQSLQKLLDKPCLEGTDELRAYKGLASFYCKNSFEIQVLQVSSWLFSLQEFKFVKLEYLVMSCRVS